MREQTATRFVAAAPDDVFGLITAPDRLPEWNGAIVRVVDAPQQLSVGAEWVVQLSALGQSWPSRSTVLELDPETRHFAYRSQTDDGNPSYADWSWRGVRRSRRVRGDRLVRAASRDVLAARVSGESSSLAIAPTRDPRVAARARVASSDNGRVMTEVVTFVDEGLGHSSYLVDFGDGRALVIDPPRIP